MKPPDSLAPDAFRPSAAMQLEGFGARLALRILRGLGPVQASNLGGRLFRTIGPLLPVSRVARDNLRLAMPELGAKRRKQIVRGVWENIGRTFCEWPHLGHLPKDSAAGPGWELIGEEHLLEQVRIGGPVIFVSGHIGNWEMLPAVCAHYGLPFASLYRASSNPLIDALMRELRAEAIGAEMPIFAKGAKGARAALGHIARGGNLGFLVDQKMNDGIEARFFGHAATTAPAAAVMALRYRASVIPGHVERIGPARFRLVCEPPLALPEGGDRQQEQLALTQTINDIMERWIREKPESWLWLHRRWPSIRALP